MPMPQLTRISTSTIPADLQAIVSSVKVMVRENQDLDRILSYFIEQITPTRFSKNPDLAAIYNNFAELVNARLMKGLHSSRNKAQALDDINMLIRITFPRITCNIEGDQDVNPAAAIPVILSSIAQNGIVPASSVARTTTPLLKAADAGQTLSYACFNLVSLESLNRANTQLAFEMLREHSDGGWLQIALEREHPTVCSTSEAFQDEITKRIMATALFICKERSIPGKSKDIRCEETSDVLFHEIHLENGIPATDILAVLVPEHLYGNAAEIFGAKAISVPPITCGLNLSAHALSQAIRLDDSGVRSIVGIQNPNYLKALTDFIIAHQMKGFMVHITKLPYTSAYPSNVRHVPTRLGLEQLIQATELMNRYHLSGAPSDNKFISDQQLVNWEGFSYLHTPITTVAMPIRTFQSTTEVSKYSEELVLQVTSLNDWLKAHPAPANKTSAEIDSLLKNIGKFFTFKTVDKDYNIKLSYLHFALSSLYHRSGDCQKAKTEAETCYRLRKDFGDSEDKIQAALDKISRVAQEPVSDCSTKSRCA